MITPILSYNCEIWELTLTSFLNEGKLLNLLTLLQAAGG